MALARITNNKKAQIQVLVCSAPMEKGFAITHWTHRELSKAIVEQNMAFLA